jgi:hypothetical protein
MANSKAKLKSSGDRAPPVLDHIKFPACWATETTGLGTKIKINNVSFLR